MKILIILLFIPMAGSGQVDTAYKKWRVGLSFEPQISYRQLGYSLTKQWIEEIRDENEIPKIGFNGGVIFAIN